MAQESSRLVRDELTESLIVSHAEPGDLYSEKFYNFISRLSPSR